MTAALGGYLFGTGPGTAYSVVGATVGGYVAFALSRRYGRSYVERTLDPALVERFDAVAERAGAPGLFVLFLLPGFPDDVLCFTAGVARIDRATFLGLVLVGRTPGFLLTSYAGGSVATDDPTVAAVVAAAGVALSIGGFGLQDALVGGAAGIGARVQSGGVARSAVRRLLANE